MIDNINDQKRKQNEIQIHLNFNSNKFYMDVLNKWCQKMTQGEIARIFKPHYFKESVKSITRQITLDESGCYEIKKIIIDAFVLYFSDQNLVTNQSLNEQVACTDADCQSQTAYAFRKSEPEVLCFKHKLKGMIIANACTGCDRAIQNLRKKIADLWAKASSKEGVVSLAKQRLQ